MSLSSFSNLELGPVAVFFGQLGAEVNIGPTVGGGTLTDEVETIPLHEDETGNTPQGLIQVGRNSRFECILADITYEKLAKVIPGAVLHTDGTKRLLEMKVNVGADLAPSKTGYPAQRLVLKKIKSPSLGAPAVISTSPNDWIIANRVALVTNLSQAYNVGDQRGINATFMFLPDANDTVWMFGDESATP